MQAIILAAGLGTRLKNLTTATPKCLIPVGGVTILANSLDVFAQYGITRTSLVIGFAGDKIRNFAKTHWGPMEINYVENAVYEKTNTGYSLYLALQTMTADQFPVLILEGDVFFEPALLELLPGESVPDKTIVEPYNPLLEGTFVALDGSGRITDWWHKSQQPEYFDLTDKYKTVNIHQFTSEFIRDLLLPVLREQIDNYEGKAPLEYALKQVIRERGALIKAVKTNGRKWAEIDDPNDLERAEILFR
jgi:choline kinase